MIDPALARKARKRVSTGSTTGTWKPVPPVAALRASLTGVLDIGGEELQVHPGASLLKLRDRVVDASTVAPLAPPPGLEATLRDYQLRGLTWLAELTVAGLGACLADDMGLGKTVTLIALHLHRRDRKLATGPTLVVCPASLLGNWEAEIRRFAPGVAGPPLPRRARATLDGRRPDGLRADDVRHDAPRPPRPLATVPWDLVVADEAQHVKNATSSTARNLRTIGSRARVALTGTPVENDLTELWAILDWTTPGLLGSRAAFRKVWAAPIESGEDPAKARQFAQLVEPFLLRRRKSDPGIAPELPPKTETDQVVALTREQVVLYEALVRESMERIEHADEDTRRGLVLNLLTGLKQICNHPAQYLQTGRRPTARALGEARAARRAARHDPGRGRLGPGLHPVRRDGPAARAAPRRRRHHHPVPARRHPGAAREQMVAAFQAGEAPVFLLSLKAGGTGLNLTRADHVIHFDRWWNPAVEDQATDRAYRIGQTRPVQVHRLITEGTIEQRIGELLARKRTLAESVLGSGEAALTELSDGELRDLVVPADAPCLTPRSSPAGPACAAPHRAAPPGGAARSCAPSRRPRTTSPTSSPDAPSPAPAGSARSWCCPRWPRPSSIPAPTGR